MPAARPPSPGASAAGRASSGMDEQQASFGERLRQFRVRAGLSQAALAERANLSPAAVMTLERGVRSLPYRRTVEALAEALGLAPADRAALAAAAQHARRLRPTPASRPAQPVEQAPPLPVWLTSFVGREGEIASIRTRLDPTQVSRSRLLTLTGPGGVGKTRLALAAAAQLGPDYGDGVVFVDLAPLRDHRLVPATIARVLGVRESGGRSAHDLLLEHLRERQLLLVLDNFEHLLQAAPLLPELLQQCPRLALLVTSRAALRLGPEQRCPVAPLATPREHLDDEIGASPAVQLFVARARVVAADFGLDPHNAEAIAAICRRLDGLPLAIELAAARVGLLRPDTLLRRLEHRLPLLTAGAPDLPERQQTLRATLAWSHDLLDPAAQVLFRRLAVFAGGGTLEAAEAICADARLPADATLEALQTLVDSSLVQRAQAGRGGDARLQLLETVREYAEERLIDSGEAALIRARHRDWYLAWAERADPELTGPDEATWYARLAEELDNLRAARAWSRADPNGAAAELRLAAALGRYWYVRAPGPEARQWLSDALTRDPGGPTAARCVALVWSGQLEHTHGQAERGEARLREAVAVARQQADPRVLTLALRHRALYALDLARAAQWLEEAAAVARAADDQRELALALAFWGIVPQLAGDLPAAERLFGEALAAARRAGDASAIANVLILGALTLARGEPATAAGLLTEAAELSEAIDYRLHLEKANRQLAQLALQTGELATAARRIRASLETVRGSGRVADGLWPLRVAAGLVAALGQPARAVELFAAEAAARGSIAGAATLLTRWAAPSNDEDQSALCAALGEATFAAAWAAGRALSLDEAIARALAVVGSGLPQAEEGP